MDSSSHHIISDEERSPRRVRSTGDIRDPTEPNITHPPRTRTHAHRRSEAYSPYPSNQRPALTTNVQDTFGRFPPPRTAQLVVADPPPRAIPNQPRREARTTNPPPMRHGLIGAIMTLLGYQGPDARARKEVVVLVFNICFGFVQFAVIIAFLVVAATHESPTKPGLKEWDACDRPLGIWNSIWLVRVVLGAILNVWGFKRDRAIRLTAEQAEEQTSDNLERGRPNNDADSPTLTARPPPPGRATHGRADSTSGNQNGRSNPNNPPINLPYTQLFSKLTLVSSLLSLCWFLTAHVLEYTSVNTCRLSAPHLWWLTFGILCIVYLMILEIFLLGLLVFILGPLIYVAWSIVLLCLGRHPYQNPFYFKPEIGKLPKSVVDQIPLVLYIPAPPEDSRFHVANSPILFPSPAHTYPPKPPTVTAPPRKRFAFLRSKDGRKAKDEGSGESKNKSAKGKNRAADESLEKTWEDNWEGGEYPFVRLEGNRATCAICLMDFEEPKRTGDSALPASQELDHPKLAEREAGKDVSDTSGIVSDSASVVEEVQVEEITQEDREQLQLEDAGEGAQPLRLLSCGHVFHKTCLDPWLTDVSGRCPVCQRAVEIPAPSKRDKRRRHNSTNPDPNANPPP